MLFTSFLEIEARFTSTHNDITPSGAVIHACVLRVTLTAKKTSVHRTENEDWIHGKRDIFQKFTHVLRTENPTFSVRSRIGES